MERFPQHNIKLLDCTIRDGGLVTDSNFSDSFVKSAYLACCKANIDIFEIGFRNGENFFDKSKFGKWRFCKDCDIFDFLKSLPRKIKISELVDAGKCDWRNFPKKDSTAVDIIRCAFYEPQKKSAIDIVNACADKGFKTSLCMMAASTLDDCLIEDSLEAFSKSEASCIYLMDSFGALLPDRVRELSKRYAQFAHASGKLFGIHCHNNLQCAFANTLAAVECGADIADCTLGGLGKGAGNCFTEMAAFAFNDKYNPRPLMEFAQDELVKLKEQYAWGFSETYMLTGLLNQHPRGAMEFEKAAKCGGNKSVTDFYDALLQ